jgi:Ssp1 endopeptidase immunity protein Rap1a
MTPTLAVPIALYWSEAGPHWREEADRDDQRNLSWCGNHLSAILENYRSALDKRNRVPKGVSICLPEGMTDAELLLIVLDELRAQDRSATLAKVITDTLSVWWPCRR